MQEVRCKNCNKFYAKATIFVGVIKCFRCKMIFEYHVYTNTLYVNNQFDSKAKSGTMSLESNATKAIIS